MSDSRRRRDYENLYTKVKVKIDEQKRGIKDE